MNYSNTKFVLLSSFEYDTSKMATVSHDRKEYIDNEKISLVIADSSVTFKNIRFEGKKSKTTTKNIDFFYVISEEGIVFMQATHLEDKRISFI